MSIQKKLFLLRLRAAFAMCSVGDCLTTIYSLLHVLQARQCTLLAPHGKAQYSKPTNRCVEFQYLSSIKQRSNKGLTVLREHHRSQPMMHDCGFICRFIASNNTFFMVPCYFPKIPTHRDPHVSYRYSTEAEKMGHKRNPSMNQIIL